MFTIWDKLFTSVDLLQKGLEASWTRNTVIRNNLANVETPGFKSSDLEFESIFARALDDGSFEGKRTREQHIQIGNSSAFNVSPLIVENKGTSMRMDGNNVDAEAENVKLAQNSIQYNTIMYKLNSELTKIKLAISEGR